MNDGHDRMLPGFERIEEGGVILMVRKAYAEQICDALGPLHQAWERIAQRRFTARGRVGIVSLSLGKAGPSVMIRRYTHGGLFGTVAGDRYFGPDRAINELVVAEAAHSGGIRTPVAVGVLAGRTAGPFWRLAYISLEVANSEDLVHYCCCLADYPAESAAIEKRGAIREVARQIRKMHDIGIYHADLHLKNLLLRRRDAGTPEVYVIDFDNAQLGPPLNSEQRLRNLKRLARSVRKVLVANSVLTAWDRLRFLRAYLKGIPDERALMRKWARRLASSGRSHEIWWTLSGAQRALRGDHVGQLAKMSRKRRR